MIEDAKFFIKDGNTAIDFFVSSYKTARNIADLARSLTQGSVINNYMRFHPYVAPIDNENGNDNYRVRVFGRSIAEARSAYKALGSLYPFNPQLNYKFDYLELFIETLIKLKWFDVDKAMQLTDDIRNHYSRGTLNFLRMDLAVNPRDDDGENTAKPVARV